MLLIIEIDDFLTFRSTKTEFSPRESTVKLLTTLNQDFELAVLSKNEDMTGVSVEVRRINIEDGNIFVVPTPVQVNVDDFPGVINRSSIPLGVQIAHPNLKLMNNGQLRDFADKEVQVKTFPELFPVSVSIPSSIKVASDLPTTVLEFINTRTGLVVVKAVNGMDGNRIARLNPDPTDIADFIREQNRLRVAAGKQASDFILQPFTPSQEIVGLKGYDEENQKLLEKYGAAIELRVYFVGNPNNQYMHVVGRGVELFEEEKQDDWILLNQDVIPPELIVYAS